MDMNRFNDEGRYEFEFRCKFDVVCPKCGGKANVIDTDRSRPGIKRATCAECGFNHQSSPDKWWGPVYGAVYRRCYQCGRRLSARIEGPKHPYEYKLKCPGCKCVMIEAITWKRCIGPVPHDPHFGFNLWFTGTVKGNLLWAYNREHLMFLKNYCEAKLRTRAPNKSSSLASRLPDWLLSAKNREASLREINRMLSKRS